MQFPSGFVQKRFGGWLERRVPPASQITLSQDSIFIFPTGQGIAFGLLIASLMLGAINYQSSLVYGVAFLLGSLFLVTILHTFKNLSGVQIEFIGTPGGFVGEDIEFEIRVSRSSGGGREGIRVAWPNTVKQWVDIQEREACTIRLFVQAEQRGWFNPGRMLIETYYPLGLLRAWTWVDLTAVALIYPKPIHGESPLESATQRDTGTLVDPLGSDDFTDVREYQPGDPIKHIIWKSYARTGTPVIKQYSSFLDPRFMLDWNAVQGGTEERLSRLTGLALDADRRLRDYGLEIPGTNIPPACGSHHLQGVLKALALYGIEDHPESGASS